LILSREKPNKGTPEAVIIRLERETASRKMAELTLAAAGFGVPSWQTVASRV
jgi:hypothetical protein